MFYLAAYALMNIGAFAVVVYISGKGERFQNVEDFAGLGRKQPFAAAMLTVFLLSLIGVPLTAASSASSTSSRRRWTRGWYGWRCWAC